MLTPDRLPFLDLQGNLRHAHALSLLDRAYFLTLRSSCLKLASHTDLRLLYDQNSAFREMANACLLMCGISPAWVDAQMMCRLLFGLGEELPLLVSLNFPERKSEGEGEPLPDGYDPDAYNIASLWAYTNDLEQALRLARDEPWTLLSEVLKSRSHQIKMSDPKEQKKKQQQQLGQDFKNLAKSGKLDAALAKLDKKQEL